MDKLLIFTLSSNELRKAQSIQQQILQKDLQLELLDINNRYRPTFGYNNYPNMLNRQNILLEKNRLISQRDENLSNAVNYALDILSDDIERKDSGLLSIGGMAINSIVSFVTAYRITFALSFPVRIKFSQVMVKLFLPDYTYWDLKNQLEKLTSYVQNLV